MFILFTTIEIKKEHRTAFLAAMLEDVRDTLEKEPGCLRLDVLQDLDPKEPNTIHLYEVYRDREAFDAHCKTSHYEKWRTTVEQYWVKSSGLNRL